MKCPICGIPLIILSVEVEPGEITMVLQQEPEDPEPEGYLHPSNSNAVCPLNFSFISLEQFVTVQADMAEVERLEELWVNEFEPEEIFA